MTMKINTDLPGDKSAAAKRYLYNSALEAEKNKDYKKALEFYKMALKIDAHMTDSWINAGALYSKLGRPDKAIICYQRAIQNGQDKRASYNLATEYFKAGDFPKAKASLFAAIKADKYFIQAHLLLGYTYGKLNENAKAEISILNVLKLDPQNVPALTAIALLYFHQDKKEQCLRYLQILLKLKPNDSIVLKLNANLKLDSNLEESILSFKKMAENDQKLKLFYETLNEQQTNIQKETIRSKKKDLEKKSEKNAKDLLDLSLLTLFSGDAPKAMDYLLEASKKS